MRWTTITMMSEQEVSERDAKQANFRAAQTRSHCTYNTFSRLHFGPLPPFDLLPPFSLECAPTCPHPLSTELQCVQGIGEPEEWEVEETVLYSELMVADDGRVCCPVTVRDLDVPVAPPALSISLSVGGEGGDVVKSEIDITYLDDYDD